jgi:hypothetical protein
MTLLGVAGLVALAIWLLARFRHRTTEDRTEEIDWEELEEAERDVRDRDVNARPEEEQHGDDWGPGAPK